MLWRIDMKRRVVICFADTLLMFINSLIEKLSRRRGPECQLSCKAVGTDPKIDARIFGSAADSNSFNLSSKVSSYSIFPPCPKTTTPPALKLRHTRKTLIPLRPKWPVCINFSLHSNSRCPFKLLCSCLGGPVNDFSVRLSRPNKQFLLHQRIHRFKNKILECLLILFLIFVYVGQFLPCILKDLVKDLLTGIQYF